MSADRSQPKESPSIVAPPLGYEPVPDIFELPVGTNFGACSSVAVNSRGHIFVFHRSAQALMEFDAEGTYLRTLVQGVFTRPHGLRIDAQDYIWATDGASNIVVKMDPNGRFVMVLGVKDSTAEWHQAGHLRCFDEPNDIAFGPDGEIYVSQGHGKGESRHPGTPCGLCMCRDQRHMFLAHGHTGKIMKLDLNGTVLGITGGQGKGPNQYGEAHFIAAANDESALYIADPLNWRVQTLVRR